MKIRATSKPPATALLELDNQYPLARYGATQAMAGGA
jgi:hypothetical protein